MFSGQNVVKLFNGEEKSIEEFKKYNDELYSSAWTSAIFSGLMQPCAKVIRQLEFCRRMRAWRISSRQWAAGCGQYSGVYSVRKDSLISLSLNLPAWQTLSINRSGGRKSICFP